MKPACNDAKVTRKTHDETMRRIGALEVQGI